MTALIASSRALCALALSAAACAVYGPDLVPLSAQGGAAGGASVAGSMADGGMQGASGGDVSDGGSSGESNSGLAGEGGQPPEPQTVPYLTVAISAPLINVPLTSEGTLDWAHWGLASASERNQKAGVTSLLLDFKPTGAQEPMRFLKGPIAFNWSDGMPTANATTNDGISWQGVGEGFEIVVPAVLSVRRLRLYVGVFNGTGVMKAALSDPRAHSVGNDKFSSQSAAWVLQMITIDYGNADVPETTMAVSWSLESARASNAAVALTAITIGNR